VVSHNEMLLEIETLLVKATELQKRYEEGLLRINELTNNLEDYPQINKAELLDLIFQITNSCLGKGIK
tara:strand:- start:761 stop:964 length:204 start_codon:yes stop_codon:yes gene_type:complete